MDGIHDLGGAHGFGAVDPRRDEPPFGEPWEGRVHGMLLALVLRRAFPPGSFRHAIERMDPVHYLTSGYYEHWLAAIETLGREAGHLSADELEAWMERIASGEPVPQRSGPDDAEAVRTLLRPFRDAMPPASQGRFAAGDRVRVRRVSHPGHTRCPAYVRGAPGTVDRVHAPAPLPDAQARGESVAEAFYTVAFEAAELWEEGEPGHTVRVDLWESYLDPADGGAR